MSSRFDDLRHRVGHAEEMRWRVSEEQFSALGRLRAAEAALDRAHDILFQVEFQQTRVSGRSRYAEVWEVRARAELATARARLAEAEAEHAACQANLARLNIRLHAVERDLAYARGRLADYHREYRYDRNGESTDPYRNYKPLPKQRLPNKPPPKPVNSQRRSQRKPTFNAQPSQAEITGWFQSVDTVFADVSTMQNFPQPPSWNCGKPACEDTKANRALEACSCNIKHLFSGRTDLKSERLRWHPDKFTRTAADRREGFQKMAREVFVVVDSLYRAKQK